MDGRRPPDFDGLLGTDRSAARLYLFMTWGLLGLGGLLVLIGLAASAFGLSLPVSARLLPFAGAFVASFAIYPLREYRARQRRAGALLVIRRDWDGLAYYADLRPHEFAAIRERVWRLYTAPLHPAAAPG